MDGYPVIAYYNSGATGIVKKHDAQLKAKAKEKKDEGSIVPRYHARNPS